MACRSPAVSPNGKVMVMATSKNGKKHSTVRPAPDQSSLRSVAPDPKLHHEGVVDEVAGKTQAAVGRTKRKVGEAIEHVGNVIKK